LTNIKRLGGDVENDNLYERSLDAKKAEAFLKERNVPLDEFRPSGVSLRVSTRKADKRSYGSA